MKRAAQFWEIPRNICFADNIQKLPQEIVITMIVHGNSNPNLTFY